MINFLNNWIDTNVIHPAEPLFDDLDALCRRFLTDAVAAGHTLHEVNERWTDVEGKIARALRTVASGP